MKLLFDQNISFRILAGLPPIFKESSHVKSEKLTDQSDDKIWQFAKSYGFTIVTHDTDFYDINVLYGFPPKII